VHAEIAKWTRIIKDAGIKLDRARGRVRGWGLGLVPIPDPRPQSPKRERSCGTSEQLALPRRNGRYPRASVRRQAARSSRYAWRHPAGSNAPGQRYASASPQPDTAPLYMRRRAGSTHGRAANGSRVARSACEGLRLVRDNGHASHANCARGRGIG
jgi:hypothetical protein